MLDELDPFEARPHIWTHLFLNPGDLEDGARWYRADLPTESREVIVLGRSRHKGLHFKHKTVAGRLVLVFVVIFLLCGSLVFGSYWTAVKKDMSGAWTVGSYIVSFLAILIALSKNR